jgi:energy-converting hydrogenase Eha subunit A
LSRQLAWRNNFQTFGVWRPKGHFSNQWNFPLRLTFPSPITGAGILALILKIAGKWLLAIASLKFLLPVYFSLYLIGA